LPAECEPLDDQEGSMSAAWVVHPLSVSWAILECRRRHEWPKGPSKLGGLFVSRWRSGAPGLGLEAWGFPVDHVAASPTRGGGLVLAHSNLKKIGPLGLQLFRVSLPANDTASGDTAVPHVARASSSWGEFAQCYPPDCSFAPDPPARAYDIGDGGSTGRFAVTFTRLLLEVRQNCLAIIDWSDGTGFSWRLYAFEGDADKQRVVKVVRSGRRNKLMIELVHKIRLAPHGYRLSPAAMFRARLLGGLSLTPAI